MDMPRLAMRALRGATTVERDEPLLIREAVHELLDAMLNDNDLGSMNIVSVVFTATPDLVSEFPAHAARLYGWTNIPLLCAQELPVDGALKRCVRVLIHVESTKARHELKHVYLRAAVLLRQDLQSD